MRHVKGLTLDIGGSELRALPLGSDEVTCIKNECVSITENNFRFKQVDDKAGLCEIVNAPKEEYLGYIAVGNVGRAYNSESIALNSGEPKTHQENYYKQIIYMIAREALQECVRSGLDMRTNFGERLEYVLVNCIPVREHSGSEDCATKLKNKLAGEYTVRFPLFDEPRFVRFSLRSEYTGIVPEGGVAMTGLRSKVEDEDITLIIDIGEVTGDICLYNGKSMYGGKVVSTSWAGRTLISNLRMSLNDAGYVLATADIPNVLKTGRVKVGVDEVSVIDIVQEEKKNFVRNYLKEEILNLLNANKIMPSQVQNVVPVGAVMNSIDGMVPLYDYILDDCKLQFAHVYTLADDLRYVNIKQAELYTKLLYDKVTKTL